MEYDAEIVQKVENGKIHYLNSIFFQTRPTNSIINALKTLSNALFDVNIVFLKPDDSEDNFFRDINVLNYECKCDYVPQISMRAKRLPSKKEITFVKSLNNKNYFHGKIKIRNHHKPFASKRYDKLINRPKHYYHTNRK